MESISTGTVAGTGSFRCEQCGYVVTLSAADVLPACPSCGGQEFVRASLFASSRFGPRAYSSEEIERLDNLAAQARRRLTEPGSYLAYERAGQIHVVPLTKERTRVGRSLAADLRLDDPTVSRRHAIIVVLPEGVRVLDDRSLNGLYVNGARTEWSQLEDGDQIVVGRFRLWYFNVTSGQVAPASAPGPVKLLGPADEEWRALVGPLLTDADLQVLGASAGGVTKVVVVAALAFESSDGTRLYPAFQFDPVGEPYGSIARIARAFLKSGIDPYTTAAWFTSPASALDERTPAEWVALDLPDELLNREADRARARLSR